MGIWRCCVSDRLKERWPGPVTALLIVAACYIAAHALVAGLIRFVRLVFGG